MLLIRKNNIWKIYYLFISSENKEITKRINFYNVPSDFKGKIVVFDEKNHIVQEIDPSYVKNSLAAREPETMTCYYIGYYLDDGSFEAIMLLGCSGNEGDNGIIDYGDYTWTRSGGGGTSGGYTAVANQKIIDSLQGYPCAQEILKHLPDINNDLARTINNLFNKNNKIDITFVGKANLGESIDGLTNSSSSIEFQPFKAKVFLNEQVLQNSTKEYILITMYHEALHAYLDYEYFRLGEIQFRQQYQYVFGGFDYTPDGLRVNRYNLLPDHNYFGGYMNDLKNILKNYNSNLPDEVIEAMVKAGITTMTAREIELNKQERDTSLNKYKGSKCP